MNNTRLTRVNDEIKKEAANIIRGELQDPRIGAMTSVTRVNTSSDLSQCKIYVSIFGTDEQKNDVMEGLQNSAGFVRKLLAERINLRNTPEIKFFVDDSMEYSAKIDQIIKEINSDKDK